MKNSFGKNIGVTLAVSLAFLNVTANAQPTWGLLVTFGAASATTSSVPTLSEWGMVGLSLTLAALAIYKMKNKSGGKPLASIAVALVFALGSLSSSKLVSEAQAIPIPSPTTCVVSGSPPHQCTVSAANGSVVVQSAVNQGDVEIINNTSVVQSVTGVTAMGGSDQILVPLSGTPQCVVGLVVAAGASCFVRNGNGA